VGGLRAAGRSGRQAARRPGAARLLALLLAACGAAAGGAGRAAGEGDPGAPRLPNVVVLTVDALRADRLSAYGYRRPTSPAIDRLLASGVRFSDAHTVEPLTNPALCSLFTSVYPHQHGATRNGLRLRPELPSLATALAAHGYRTAAFVGTWPLRDRLSGLGRHFDRYDEILTRKRWFGLFKGEATAEDLTDAALSWLRGSAADGRPFLLWVHYAEPHAPYRLQPTEAPRLGLPARGEVARSDRYDTEVAFADRHLGRLVEALLAGSAGAGRHARTLFVFAADHGESLGEHNDWGHGRNLFEPALRIPMGIAWPGRIRPAVVDAPALILDLAPTVLALAGLPAPAVFRGFDWTPVLAGSSAPRGRVVWFEAHRGAVLSQQEAAAGARRRGLLQVGRLAAGRKEIWSLGDGRHWLLDLGADPGESGAPHPAGDPSAALRAWRAEVERGLASSDRRASAAVPDAESLARLRALGYAQ
jgi:arylsulfatase A-like enzyme